MSKRGEIEICDVNAFTEMWPVRKAIVIVILLGIKNRAERCKVEQSLKYKEWKIHYEKNNRSKELVPLPMHLPLTREVRRLAGLGFWQWIVAWFKNQSLETVGKITLILAGQEINIGMSLHPPHPGIHEGESIKLEFPDIEPSLKVNQFIDDFFEKLTVSSDSVKASNPQS